MSRTPKIAIAAVLVVILALGAGTFWFLRDDAPAAVSLDTASAVVVDRSTTTAGGSASSSTAATATDETTTTDGVSGTWTVDTETGDVTYESATGTFAGFRIDEELAGIGDTEAVGRTDEVSGEMTIDGTTLTAATFEVDLTGITTETSMRDDKVQSALETSTYPTATFVLTEPVDLGSGAADGSDVTVTAVGELTIHGVTRAASFELQARLVDDTVVVVGSTEISFADIGVEVPSSGRVLSVADLATIELQLLLVR